jgi:hypothetical protein
MESISGINLASISEASKRRKPSGERRGFSVIKAILVKLVLEGVMKPGEIVTARAIAEAIYETPARSTVWSNVQSVEGLAKAVGDILGRHCLNLPRSGNGYVLPDLKKEAEQQLQ